MAADNLCDVLNEIRAQRGALTPEIVLNEATNPAHPLHHRFEWEDSEAAHKYRLIQAARLLRVKYKVETASGVRDLRAFVVTRPIPELDGDEAPSSEYTPIEEVLMNPIQRQLLLNQMRRDWKTFKSRYDSMEEFADFITAQLTEGKDTA